MCSFLPLSKKVHIFEGHLAILPFLFLFWLLCQRRKYKGFSPDSLHREYSWHFLVDHIWYWGFNPGQLCVKQVPYLLSCLSDLQYCGYQPGLPSSSAEAWLLALPRASCLCPDPSVVCREFLSFLPFIAITAFYFSYLSFSFEVPVLHALPNFFVSSSIFEGGMMQLLVSLNFFHSICI